MLGLATMGNPVRSLTVKETYGNVGAGRSLCELTRFRTSFMQVRPQDNDAAPVSSGCVRSDQRFREMAVPKKKTSKSKRNMRRAHDALTPINLAPCSHCGAPRLPHSVCETCGFYRGRTYPAKYLKTRLSVG